MKRKPIVILSAVIILLLCISVLAITPYRSFSGYRTEAEVLAVIDNETPKEQLITKSYRFSAKKQNNIWIPFCALGSSFGWEQSVLGTSNLDGFRLDRLDRYFKIEALRKPDPEHLYTILRDQKGNYMYVLFVFYEDASENYWYVDRTWYPLKSISKSDFLTLQIGISSYEDVKQIDRDADVLWYGYSGHFTEKDDIYAGETTIYDTQDGFTVKIYYSKEDNTIADLQFVSDDAHALHTYLLLEDWPQ